MLEPQPYTLNAPAIVIPTPEKFEPGKVRVGLLLPLSGPRAGLGDIMLKAAQLALFDAGDDSIILLPRDTRGTAEGAAAAAQSAVDDGARVILGPVFSTSIRGATPIAREFGVPLIGFSTDRSVAGNGVYILGFTPQQQVDRIIGFAAANGRSRIAALIPYSAYGDAILQSLRVTANRRGVSVVQVERYEEDEQLLYDPVRRLARYDRRQAELEAEKQALAGMGDDDDFAQELLTSLSARDTYGGLAFDSVFIPAGGAMLRALAPLLFYYDVDPRRVQYLGTGLWDDPGLSREPALDGAWYAGPPPESASLFRSHFQNTYRARPPRVASLAYDSVALVAALLRQNPNDPFGFQNLTNPKGFAGIDGVFRLGTNGVAERGLAVIEISPDGTALIDNAPVSFTTITVTPAQSLESLQNN